jgi:hypothetical protein
LLSLIDAPIQLRSIAIITAANSLQNRISKSPDELDSSRRAEFAPWISTRFRIRRQAHESFREAAAELGVTPTAISHQIRLLEEICGQPLFRRRPRPLMFGLTADGDILLSDAQ